MGLGRVDCYGWGRLDRGTAQPLLQRHRVNTEVFCDLLKSDSRQPSQASQIRCHVTVQQPLILLVLAIQPSKAEGRRFDR